MTQHQYSAARDSRLKRVLEIAEAFSDQSVTYRAVGEKVPEVRTYLKEGQRAPEIQVGPIPACLHLFV